MSDSTVRNMTPRLKFVPGTTLGRSGHTPSKEDRLSEEIEFLDALLCLITSDIGEPDSMGFQNQNNSIQASVLHLASRMATEVHELHKALQIEKFNAKCSHE